MKKINYLLMLLCFSLFIVSCEKDGEDDKKTTPAEMSLVGDDESILEVPEALMTTPAAAFVSQIYMVDAYTSLLAWNEGMDKVSDNAYRASYNYGGQSFTYYWTYFEQGDKNVWTIEFQQGNSRKYKYMEAWETKDGKKGSITYYSDWAEAFDDDGVDDDYQNYLSYVWEKFDDGSIELTYMFYSDDDDNSGFEDKYIITVNADYSGTAILYDSDGGKEFLYEWDAVGNGSYTTYDDDGNEVETINWTV